MLRRLALLPLGLILASTLIQAADHRESPTADGLPEGDIGDFFAFLDPNDASQLVMIMTVNTFAVPAVRGSYRLATNILYQFKIDNTGDAREDLVVQLAFRDVDTSICSSGQRVLVYGPTKPATTGARNFLTTDPPSVVGCTGAIVKQNGMSVSAALQDDPFVFDIGQFNRILNGSQDVFRDLPSTSLGHLRGRSLHADGTSGVDAFGGFNVTSLAVELPKASVSGNATRLNLWATTSTQVRTQRAGQHEGAYTQFQRVGQPAFKTVFVPASMRDAYNESIPEEDFINWPKLIPNTLTSTDTSGNAIADRYDLLDGLGLFTGGVGAPAALPRNFQNTDTGLLLKALEPDVLRLDLQIDSSNLAVGQFGLSNGRRPGDDSVDIALRLVRQLADVDFAGSGRAGALPFPLTNLAAADRRVLVVLQGTDFIRPDQSLGDLAISGNDRPLRTVFPFLGLPHPLPGDTTPAPGTVGFPVQQ